MAKEKGGLGTIAGHCTVILTNVLTCGKILISDHMGMIIQILLQTESI